jgi:hypothetical protein
MENPDEVDEMWEKFKENKTEIANNDNNNNNNNYTENSERQSLNIQKINSNENTFVHKLTPLFNYLLAILLPHFN